ncbi:MAG: ABC transporter ATP-binding protein [Candidatus Kariarchaeaceae archaeon]|jgi:ABC-2 type transport system ATP-binding protein
MTTSEKGDVSKSNSQRDILIANDLSKSYGRRPALEGLTFTLRSGRILGLLGPNGAGKTTAIRILTTIIEQSSGFYKVDGFDSSSPENIRERIGVVPESHGFPKQMTGYEYLSYFGRLYNIPKVESQKRANELLSEVGLTLRKNSLIGSYSRGMRQRLGIARALINNPVVMFLDEPTLGLDPKGQEELLTLIAEIAKVRNSGIIFCSHLLTEVERVCDDVVILKNGKVVASGTVSEIIGKGIVKVIRLRVDGNKILEAQELLEKQPNVKTVQVSSRMTDWIEIELSQDTSNTENHTTNRLLEVLIQKHIPILKVDTVGTRLHDVFLQLTEGAIV